MFEQFEILWLKRATKQLQHFSTKDQDKILKKIDNLKQNIEKLDIKKLESFKNLYRIRIGDYRVVYTVSKTNQTIYIVALAHRQEIYKLLKCYLQNY